MLCHDCGSTIEEGRKERAPVLARFCLKCRSERRRRHNLKYAWLPQHDAYLRAHYYGGLHRRGRVIGELARQTDFPRWYIKRQARRLGLSISQDRRPWTEEELDSLDRLLGKVSAATIAKCLKRTETSVAPRIDLPLLLSKAVWLWAFQAVTVCPVHRVQTLSMLSSCVRSYCGLEEATFAILHAV